MRPPTTWQVSGWVEAPGDFPSKSLNTVRVNAPDIGRATARGRTKLNEFSPTGTEVVSVQRVIPPYKETT